MRRSARGPAASKRTSARGKPVDPNAEDAVRVAATVVAVITEYRQTVVRTDDGRQLVITGRCGGLPWHTLREGQRIICVVSGRLSRVHSAELPG